LDHGFEGIYQNNRDQQYASDQAERVHHEFGSLTFARPCIRRAAALPWSSYDAPFEWVMSRKCRRFPDSIVKTSTETGQPNMKQGATAEDMVNGWSRRIVSTAVRIVGALALALLLTTAMTSHAGAEPNNGPAMDKPRSKRGAKLAEARTSRTRMIRSSAMGAAAAR